MPTLDGDEKLDFWSRRKLIRESKLSSQQKLLLYVIADYEGQGNCWASVPTLALDIGLKQRQARYVLSTLISSGVVIRTNRPGKTSLLNVQWDSLIPRQRSAGVQSSSGRQCSAGDPGSVVPPTPAAEYRGPRQPTASKHKENIQLTFREHPSGRKKFRPEDIELPESLNNSEFKSEWSEWCQYRREKKQSLTERSATRQISTLESYGSAVAIATLSKSIECGWTGLFPEKISQQGNGHEHQHGVNRVAAEPGKYSQRPVTKIE